MKARPRLVLFLILLTMALVINVPAKPSFGAESELVQAVRQGNLQWVQQLLRRGGQQDAYAFWLAAGLGHVEIARLLLDAGAPIEFIPANAGGYTPLLVAAHEGKLDVVKLLLDRGADTNVLDAGGNPVLTVVATEGKGQKVEVMRLLLDYGADVNARDRTVGGTALHRAAWDGNYEMAMLLLERGAVASIRVTKGSEETPAEGARNNGHTAVAQLIERGVPRRLPTPRPSQPVAPTVAEAPKPAAPVSDVDVPPARPAKPNPNAYAIVVGIEQYRQQLPKADFAANDAKVTRDYLVQVLGYPEENIALLVNERATKTDLEKYVEHWLPNRIEKDGSVFVYFSGHGAPNVKNGDAYLVPYDGDPAFVEATGYPLKRLYEHLNKLPAKEVIVMLDSCFSGAGGRSVIAKGTRPMFLSVENPILAGGKMVVLAASSAKQFSSTYDQKGHGLLTYYFLKGLRGEADGDKNGEVELAELFDYVKPQVERTARREYNNEQTPQLLGSPEALKRHIRLGGQMAPVPSGKGAIGKDGAPMVLVPAGEFMMGSAGGTAAEKPVHRVSLDAFYLDKYEVTNKRFQTFVQETGYQTTAETTGAADHMTPSGEWRGVKGANWRQPEAADTVFVSNRDEHPVVTVSWYDAEAYCRWAGKRLPTEAEFEYANRGGTQTTYWWGNDNPGSRRVANIADESAKRSFPKWTIMAGYDDGHVRTAPVGSYEPNPFGLHDTTGNVWEWVADWIVDDFYAKSPSHNPLGPPSGEFRALRGGSWNSEPESARSAYRFGANPPGRTSHFGFRCAKTP